MKNLKPYSILKLLIALFLGLKTLYLKGYIAGAPGRERYFMAVFTVVFGALALYYVLSFIRDLKNDVNKS